MHLEVNYMQMSKEDLESVKESKSEHSEKRGSMPDGYLEYFQVYTSQFETVPNEGKKNKMVWLYEKLSEIAFASDGHVILDIDEEKETATLQYEGRELYKTNEENDLIGVVFAAIFIQYEFVELVHKENCFSLTVNEILYDRKLVNDRSKELSEIKARNKGYKDSEEHLK